MNVKGFYHSAAEPQPKLTSVAKATSKSPRYGRAEARPSKGIENSTCGATNLGASNTEGTENTENTEKRRASNLAIFYEMAGKRGAEMVSAPRLIRRLLEVENIQDNFCLPIAQYNVASNDYAFAISGRRGEAAHQVGGNHGYPSFESRRKFGPEHELLLQSGRQAVFLGEAWGEICVMFGVPAAKFVTIMCREAVAAAIVIVVVVFVGLYFAPMSVSVVVAAILVVFVFIREGGGSWKHEECEYDGGKPFAGFQEFPPT